MNFPLYKIAQLSKVSTVILICFFVACKEKKHKKEKQVAATETVLTKQDYNFVDVQSKDVPEVLQEVSGISYMSDDVLAAQEDETGTIYLFNFAKGEIENKFKFGGKKDYEDIVATEDYYYVLVSNGSIVKVSRKSRISADADVIKFKKTEGEFEAMYLSADKKKLIIICKACGQAGFDAYAFDIAKDRFEEDVLFTIDDGKVQDLSGSKKEFRPSAAAIHPLENKLYVLCSVGKRLLVAGLSGSVEKVYELDDKLYAQPEGITFAPNGDLFISNEAKSSKGNIYKLPYLRAR